MSSSSVYYQWKSFEEDEDRPEKPRRFGVTEMRGPQYTLLSQNMLQVCLKNLPLFFPSSFNLQSFFFFCMFDTSFLYFF
jgi:hypothetical protein